MTKRSLGGNSWCHLEKTGPGGRNWCRGYGGTLLTGLASLFSDTLQNHMCWVIPPTVSWALLLPSLVRKMPPRPAYRSVLRRHFLGYDFLFTHISRFVLICQKTYNSHNQNICLRYCCSSPDHSRLSTGLLGPSNWFQLSSLPFICHTSKWSWENKQGPLPSKSHTALSVVFLAESEPFTWLCIFSSDLCLSEQHISNVFSVVFPLLALYWVFLLELPNYSSWLRPQPDCQLSVLSARCLTLDSVKLSKFALNSLLLIIFKVASCLRGNFVYSY